MGPLEIKNFSSCVEKIFHEERSEQVKYFSTLEEKSFVTRAAM